MDIREQIAKLKEEQDAVILAHFYVDDDVQDLADYIGDSFYLAQVAERIQNKVIVFCGVEFMGESAKLLSPEKTVLMPDATAGCPMAHMVKKETVEAARAQYDDLAVACYVNSTAEVKSWSDVCVTSSNALKICKAMPQKNILFIPDKNLGGWLAEQLPEKNFIFNDGCCPIHDAMKVEEIKALKAAHPEAKVLVHPECPAEIVAEADYAGSTSGIIAHAVEDDNKEFIIGTVVGVEHEILKRLNFQTDKKFYFPATKPFCEDMGKVTPEKILNCLQTHEGEVFVPEEYTAQAKKTLELMLELGA